MQRDSQYRAWMTSRAKGAARGQDASESGPDAAPSADLATQRPSGVRVALPIRMNGVAHAVPLRLAGAGVAAALCRGARLACHAGGFEAEIREVPVLVARIPLPDAAALARVQRRITALAGDLLQVGMDAAAASWVPIGCIPGLYLRSTAEGEVEAHVHSAKVDSAAADALRTVAGSLAGPLRCLAECAGAAGPITLCELNHQRVKARCRIPLRALFEECSLARAERLEGAGARAHLRRELELDHHDPQLAAAHNARLLEGMLGASAVLGVDEALWEGEAQRYAGRWGSCEPLVRWKCGRDELLGELRLPVMPSQAGASATPHDASAPYPALGNVKDGLLQLACVGLAASLAFSCSRWEARAARPLLARAWPAPPPMTDLGPAPSPGKRSSESGVHAVLPVRQRASTG